MTTRGQQISDAFRDLGPVADFGCLRKKGSVPGLKVNTHVHLPPNFSSFESVSQAVSLAKSQGLSVLGANNYYDFEVYGEFADLASGAGVFPIFGMEIIASLDAGVRAGTKINDPGNPGRIYVCGKGITRFAPMPAEASRLLERVRRDDARRMALMIEKLNRLFLNQGVAAGLSEDAVTARVAARHGVPRESVFLQERHVSEAFQMRFFELVPPSERGGRLANILGIAAQSGPEDAAAVQNEIRSHLMKFGKPAFVEETFPSYDEALRLILALGGIPCYPVLADGTQPICDFEVTAAELAARIRSMGFAAAELIPVRNSPEVLSEYARTLRGAGLILTAGTEHNTRELLPLEPRCRGNGDIPGDVLAIFEEGACVVAAHQFLAAHGDCGFVNASGMPNPKYSDDEARIAAFREMGAVVIERWRKNPA